MKKINTQHVGDIINSEVSQINANGYKNANVDSTFNIDNTNFISMSNSTLQQKKLLYLNIVLSVISIVLFIGIIISMCLGGGYIKSEAIVGVLGVLVTALIAWQIYNSIGINELVKKYKEQSDYVVTSLKEDVDDKIRQAILRTQLTREETYVIVSMIKDVAETTRQTYCLLAERDTPETQIIDKLKAYPQTLSKDIALLKQERKKYSPKLDAIILYNIDKFVGYAGWINQEIQNYHLSPRTILDIIGGTVTEVRVLGDKISELMECSLSRNII